jgi:uroporphyrinogen III methyltransferase/synthase
VYLIGAGPGDPGLITARGLDLLRQADVVIHDHLVSPRAAEGSAQSAELIDVGTAAPQPMAQEAISILIAEKAREGKVVARLKWGDPFVFDRGGEEALFLTSREFRSKWFPDSSRHGRAGVRRRAGDVPGRRRHGHAGSRVRR